MKKAILSASGKTLPLWFLVVLSIGIFLPASSVGSNRVAMVSLESVDLVAILHNLTERWEGTASHLPIAVEAHNRFSPLRGGKAVGMTDSIMRRSDLHALLHLALLLTGPPEFDLKERGVSGMQKTYLDRYLKALREFYLEADLRSFRGEHEAAIQALLGGFRQQADLEKAVDVCESYFGSKWDRYVIVFTPYLPGLRMSRLIESDGGPNPWVLFGPTKTETASDALRGGREFLRKIVFREIGRQFAIKALEGRKDLLDRNRRLLPLFAAENPERKPWHILFLRGLSSAIEIRLVREAFGEDVSPQVFEEFPGEEDRLVRLLNDLLEEYEDQRDRYETLADFMPQLLEHLEQRAQRD